MPGSRSRGSIGPRRCHVSGSGLAKTSASASRSTSIGTSKTFMTGRVTWIRRKFHRGASMGQQAARRS